RANEHLEGESHVQSEEEEPVEGQRQDFRLETDGEPSGAAPTRPAEPERRLGVSGPGRQAPARRLRGPGRACPHRQPRAPVTATTLSRGGGARRLAPPPFFPQAGPTDPHFCVYSLFFLPLRSSLPP